MCSANFSELRPAIYTYLGFRGVVNGCEYDRQIDECLGELQKLHGFRYQYKLFDAPPAFLLKEPYTSYLRGSTGVILSLMTLGSEVDRRIKLLGRTDVAKSVVFDACASALLEYLSDEYEKGIASNLSYRFCPGYGGSDISDIRYIFAALKPERIGISLTETNYMLPSKSMAGVIGVGSASSKNCGNCVLLKHCAYRKEGKRCYALTE